MEVKMLCSQAGSDFVRSVGDVVQVDDDEGKRLVEAGIAEVADNETKAKSTKRTKKTETATER